MGEGEVLLSDFGVGRPKSTGKEPTATSVYRQLQDYSSRNLHVDAPSGHG